MDNKLHTLIHNYVSLEQDRKARVESVLDAARGGDPLKKYMVSTLIPKRKVRTIGVTSRIEESFSELVKELVSQPCFMRFDRCEDGSILPVAENGVVRAYSSRELIPEGENSDSYGVTYVIPAFVVLSASDTEPTHQLLLDDLVLLSEEDVSAITCGDLSYRFIAADRELNTFDLSCLD